MDVVQQQGGDETLEELIALTPDEVAVEMERMDPRWELTAEESLARTFVLGDFVEAMAFANDVGDEAEKANHHPDICIFDYRKVRVELTTHAVDGLTEKDFELAKAVDAVAKER